MGNSIPGSSPKDTATKTNIKELTGMLNAVAIERSILFLLDYRLSRFIGIGSFIPTC